VIARSHDVIAFDLVRLGPDAACSGRENVLTIKLPRHVALILCLFLFETLFFVEMQIKKEERKKKTNNLN